MIISQTPFRVSFFGGGTDFPEYYREHGGAVLATSIDHYCFLSLHRLGPFFKFRIKASYSRTEAVNHPRELEHPLIRESLLHLGVDEPLEIGHIADLPGRTGIGSSSSFTVGLLHALHALRGETVTPEDLAREAIEVERVRVRDSGGHQDQYAAAYGGFMRLDFTARGVAVRRLALPAARLAALDARLMMFYTGVEQSAETIQAEQTRRVEHNLTALGELKAMVDEAQQLLESTRDLDAFGDLLHQAWLRKRTLASGITNSTIDQAYEAARSAGARGGKLLGAGGRGFLLLYAEPDRQAAVRQALGKLTEVDFRFGFEGSRIIFQQAE
jgi:D-glycero-alpha-D-manno-heptose-7-phosphate kinase